MVASIKRLIGLGRVHSHIKLTQQKSHCLDLLFKVEVNSSM